MRLLLLRHAKSDWTGGEDDHERPLAPKGRKAAPAMGAYMHAKGYDPALVLCSTAARARETLERVLPEFGRPPPVRYDRALYLCGWRALLKEIRDGGGRHSPLLLVGHNPGLERLAAALARESGTAAERARAECLQEKFPAGALAVLDFPLKDWSGLEPATGRVIDFAKPKDLRRSLAEAQRE